MILSHEIGCNLLEAKNADVEAVCLAKAAMIVREEILHVKNSFDGKSAPGIQKESVPASLITLLDMIMRGPKIQRDTTGSSRKPGVPWYFSTAGL